MYPSFTRWSIPTFEIENDAKYLQSNILYNVDISDKYYWTHGYTFTSNEVTESVPLFLTELAQEIFTCGKSINLLKACDTQVKFQI